MKFRFKYLMAGTLACLTTVSSDWDSRVVWGQETAQPSLLELLQREKPKHPLLPVASQTDGTGLIQRISYSEPAEQDGIFTGNPLQPKPIGSGLVPATLPPTTRVQGTTQSGPLSPLPAPVVSPPTSVLSSQTTVSGPIIGAPLNGSQRQVPIITGQLAPNITSSTLPTIPSQQTGTDQKGSIKPPVPVIQAMPATIAAPQAPTARGIAPIISGTGSQSAISPQLAPALNTKPAMPALPKPMIAAQPAKNDSTTPTTPAILPAMTSKTDTSSTEGSSSSVASDSSVTKSVDTTTKSSAGSTQTTGPETAVAIGKSAITTPTTIAGSSGSQTANTPDLKSGTTATDDAIEVTEMTPETMAELLNAFGMGIPSTGPSTQDLNSQAKKRVAAIGSSAAMPTETTMESATEFGTSIIGSSVQPEVEPALASPQMPLSYDSSGLNLGYQRPAMPSQLPYDGYGTISGASGYAITEFLYMGRDNGEYSLSYVPQQDGYDMSPGVRFTLGNRWDSIEGHEIGFTILETQTSHTSVISPTNSLFTWLQPVNGFTAANLSSLNNAAYHHSFHKGHYYSGEFNKVNWNWDVMSTFIGLRYTGIDELYALHSVGGGGDLGAYRLRARNHMVGPQAGGTLHYDIGRKLSFSLSAKIAGYANFYQTDTELVNNNARLMDVNDSRADLAWGTELAFFTHYSLTPRARIKGGWELWFYDRLATTQGQLNGFVSPFSGATARNGDEALFYGFSLGLEWYR